MRLDLSQQMRPEMRLRMAPRMIQSMEILQLPLLALEERIEQEIQENPVLERSETPGEEAATPEANEAERAAEELPEELVDWAESHAEASRPSRSALADRKHDAMQNMASRPRSLPDELTEQFGFLDTSPTIRAVAESVIANLDDNGYLHVDLDTVIRDSGLVASHEEAEDAIRLVQKLDPPGIGARNLRECLLLQLNPETPMGDVLEVLIRDHLEDVEQNRLPAIEKRTGLSIEAIKEAIEHLKRLDPRPGTRFAVSTNQYVVPDLCVERDEHGEYRVRLIEEYQPHLAISRPYQRLLRDRSASPEARAFLQKKIQSARWLIDSIEQRRNTILKVARAIIDHQKAFLETGPEAIEPLKMQQIADRVGVHVTTVSRAVDDKWIQTPRGLFPLKRFFGGGTTSADGEEVAWDIVKQKLLDVVANEDKSNPLSDDQIADELLSRGLTVARRTISKYRKALRIPSSRQRRVY
jgi:RNA polymerase sigma-54 factor